MRNFFLLTIVFAISMLSLISCEKESFYDGKDAALKFSMDTVSFDTVFSTIGTSTKRLMVYNPYNKKIKISSIGIAGNKSPFLMNINGNNTSKSSDIELNPHDSLYIFIQFFVNPTGQNLPFVITDSLVCKVNDNTQTVTLLAYSQDVHIFRSETIKSQVWEADKPYLIFGNVILDSLETLTISSGATIYLHKNSNLLIKGTLNIAGEFGKPVSFKGDRLEKDYLDIPGQWGGIILLPGSKNHSIRWMIAENGTSGIVLGSANNLSKPNLEITNSIIRNMAYDALLAYNARIKAVNCLIANAGTYTCGLTSGGDYEFYQCTITNYYGDYDDRDYLAPSLYLSNYSRDPLNPLPIFSSELTKADFYNSIIYGSNADELGLDSVASAGFHYKFDHCLVRSKKYSDRNTGSFLTMTWNSNPKFISFEKLNFQLDTLSPAKDAGDVQIGKLFPKDLNNNDRTLDNAPDIGAYERIEK